MLLSSGADPSLCDRWGSTLLHYCAEVSPRPCHARPARRTERRFASQRGGERLTLFLDLMLQHGADVDSRDHGNVTPLGAAIAARQFGTASLLLKRGARLLARSTPPSLQPLSLLEDAISSDDDPAAALAILREQHAAARCAPRRRRDAIGSEPRPRAKLAAPTGRAKLAALEDGTAELARVEVAKANAAASVAALELSRLTGQDLSFAMQTHRAKMAALRGCCEQYPADFHAPPAPVPEPATESELCSGLHVESAEQPDVKGATCPDWRFLCLLPPEVRWVGPMASTPVRSEDALREAPAETGLSDWTGAGIVDMQTEEHSRVVPRASSPRSAALGEAAAARRRLSGMLVATARAAAEYSDSRLAALRRPAAVQAAIDEAKSQVEAMGRILNDA